LAFFSAVVELGKACALIEQMQRKAASVLTPFQVLPRYGQSSDRLRIKRAIRCTLEYAITFGLGVLAGGWILGERW
jgi:hypothetical protein